MSKFFLIQLTDKQTSAIARKEGMDPEAFSASYLYPADGFSVGISEAVYIHTPYAKPPEDGKLRRVKPAYNWLKLRDEFLHPRAGFLNLRPVNYSWVYTAE